MKRFVVVAMVLLFTVAIGGNAFAVKGGGGGGGGGGGTTPKYSRTVTVDAAGGGDYTNFQDAYFSITDATSNKLVLLQIMPGTYGLNPLSYYSNRYVHIKGSGEGVTILEHTQSGIGLNFHYGINLSDLTILLVGNTLASGNFTAIGGAGGYSADESVDLTNVSIIINTDAPVDCRGIDIGPGISQVNINNVLININAPEGSSYALRSIATNNTVIDGLDIVSSAKFYSLGADVYNINGDFGNHLITINNLNISSTAQYYASKGLSLGSSIAYNNGLTATVTNSSLSGTEYSLSTSSSYYDSMTVSDSTIDGPISVDQSRTTFVNCIDGSGNPI